MVKAKTESQTNATHSRRIVTNMRWARNKGGNTTTMEESHTKNGIGKELTKSEQNKRNGRKQNIERNKGESMGKKTYQKPRP